MSHVSIATRIALHAVPALVIAFLMLPILAVVPASFSDARFIRLPPRMLSLRWYGDFLADPAWRAALLTSVTVAVSVTAVSVALGTAAALGLRRLPDRARTPLRALFLAPLVVPVIVTAIALYRSALDLQLNSTLIGLVLSHAVLALPFVVINVEIALRAVDEDWLKAASGLGADSWTAFRTVTLPMIMPGVLGGAIFSFVTSFDEFTVSLFMTGPQTKTLPIMIWEFIRFEFTPVVAVAATCMIALAFLLFALGSALSRRLGARRR
jgi:putative spermidine/putrescine transport system permease protein